VLGNSVPSVDAGIDPDARAAWYASRGPFAQVVGGFAGASSPIVTGAATAGEVTAANTSTANTAVCSKRLGVRDDPLTGLAALDFIQACLIPTPS